MGRCIAVVLFFLVCSGVAAVPGRARLGALPSVGGGRAVRQGARAVLRPYAPFRLPRRAWQVWWVVRRGTGRYAYR